MSARALLIIATIVTLPQIALASDPQQPLFEQRPIPKHVYDGGWEHFVGGGLASLDCNGDRLPDLIAAGGSNPVQLMVNRTAGPGAPLTFRAETPETLAQMGVTGAYPLDIDGDGLLDLALLRVGPDQLLRGVGDCQFEPFDTLDFVSGNHWTTAFSATWEAGQSLPTLAFGTYVDRSKPDGPFEACDATLLYRPDGNRYAPPTRLQPGYCALSMLFTNWQRATEGPARGRADLRISNDRHYYVRNGQEQMWQMTTPPALYQPEDGWASYHLWGMGIASRDINGDGFPDVYLTSMGDQKFQLFDPSPGGPAYRDVTYDYGTTAHRPTTGGDGRPSTGWHADFGDVNNDGRDDIFVAKGNVEQMPDAAMRDPNTLLIQDVEGRFSDMGATAGIASMARSRGAVLRDLNLDGRLDLAVSNRRAPLELLENTTPSNGAWLTLALRAPAPNTQAIGAFVELDDGTRTQTREITVGGGHAGGSAGDLHFGLGQAHTLRLRIIWPDGVTTNWQTISANQHIALSR
ncbi:CRTAC1 family protein [Phaeobacter porticola]|uniref:ASPIC and UnbV/Repeat protein domain protein in Vibrio, Colwellia, Bradyrhizobium and Shewanella n=1 Tax=Phaeobacter porticola TaxID=1844006 RepID=A0A1L3I9V3_9RHOB|nr:CRTAC1 family protein [Phaeobacter porticola]APG48947.1 ASPIC and UnbV/Repeat protein domain protein in Vibrio, Colwellia, Bradyrhizobium and Shewanella [Phaeobacter porticola]